MVVSKKIKYDNMFDKKVKSNDLNCVDCFELALADSLRKQFLNTPIYLLPQQQTKPIGELSSAVFVSISPDIHREKRLNGECEYEVAVNIAYMSKEVNAQTEQIDAAIKIMELVENIPPLEGMEYPYTIYDSTSQTVDGIVNVTGIVKIWERRKDDTPIIKIANTDVNVTKPKEE